MFVSQQGVDCRTQAVYMYRGNATRPAPPLLLAATHALKLSGNQGIVIEGEAALTSGRLGIVGRVFYSGQLM